MPLNVQCKLCANLHNDWCKLVVDSPDPDMVRDCQYYRTLTNYDRIISKSPEELAKFIEFVSAGCDYMFPDCPAHNSCKRICDQNDACGKGWLDWLKQEADI